MTLYQLMNRAIQYLVQILSGQAATDARIEALSASVADLSAALARIEAAVTPTLAARIVFTTEVDGQIKNEVTQMQLKVSKVLKVSFAAQDSKGNAAAVDGKPAWALTDANLGSLAVADDGMSAVFSASGPVGSLKIQASADADLGEGVTTIQGELQIDLIAGDAVTVALTAGEPQDPAAPDAPSA